MQRFDITQTDMAAVADPEDVVLRDELDESDLACDSLPAPPRVLRVHDIGPGGERNPAPTVVERSATLALEVPPGASRVVVLALDAEGQVIASSDLGLETAMSAEVFVDLLAAGLVSEGLDEIDLHVRLTPQVASALAAAARRAQEARRTQPIPKQVRPLPSVPFASNPRRR